MQGSLQSSSLTPFGKYLLDEEIARGGMARVYLARLRGLGGFEKKLVVKQVLPELARDPRFIEMFVEEAKTLVQMSHPHIVPVYELGVVDGVYFLAMEHVEGATLAELLREGPIPPAMVAHIGAEVCDALAYAHERFNLVHRDVTPRNVMVDALGHARLLDFGIAAPVHDIDDDQAGEVFGSPGYMSPEQARGEQVSATSDIFSLGTVLYEALTGKPAFLRESPEATRTALFEGTPPTLDGYETLPKELRALVEEMLVAKADGRPESAARLGQRLRGIVASTRPEGLAPELGERAAYVLEMRKRTPSRRPPSSEPAAPGSVRTIATSVTLRQILGEDNANGDERGAKIATPIVASDSQEGTMPIPGRKSLPDGIDAPVANVNGDAETASPVLTTPLGRSRVGRPVDDDDDEVVIASPPEAGAGAATGSVEAAQAAATREHAPKAEAKRMRLVLALATIGVALALALGVRFAFFADEVTPRPPPSTPNTPVVEETPNAPPDTSAAHADDVVLNIHPDNGTHETAVGETPETHEGSHIEPVVAQPTTGRLWISANPWGIYRVGRRELGDQPVTNLEVAAGRQAVHVSNPSLGFELDIPVVIPPDGAIEVLVDFRGDTPHSVTRAH